MMGGMEESRKNHTPIRTMRVDEQTWTAAQAAAAARGESVSDVIRRALVRYAKKYAPRA